MKYLAIDFGSKKIGLAGSIAGIIITPIKIIENDSYTKLINLLIEEINRLNPEHIVIGLPSKPDGEPTMQSNKVKSFAQMLEQVYPKKGFHYVNEYLSTNEARYRSQEKRGEKIDDQAAAIILEQFLSSAE